MIAGCECNRLPGDLKDGLAFDEYHPFVVRLNVLTGSDGRRADDSPNDKVLVAEERIEALSFIGRLCIGEEIVGSHASTQLTSNGAAGQRRRAASLPYRSRPGDGCMRVFGAW